MHSSKLRQGDVFSYRSKLFVVEVVNDGLVRFSNFVDIYDVYELSVEVLGDVELLFGDVQ